jgi:hypothetical protein
LGLVDSLGVVLGGKYKGPRKPQPFNRIANSKAIREILNKYVFFMGNKSIT